MLVHQVVISVLVAFSSHVLCTTIVEAASTSGSNLYQLLDIAILQRRAALHQFAARSALSGLHARSLSPSEPIDGAQAWRRQKTPGRGDVPSTQAQGAANVQFLKREILMAQNKYARAADVLAGKGLDPAKNFSMVDEWTATHAWDEPLGDEYQRRDEANMNGRWPLSSYVNGTMDVLYYGTISLGSPAQVTTVEIDTGSADLWIPTPKCPECQSINNRSSPPKKQYDPNTSSSFSDKHDPFHVSYGTGSVCGVLSTDRVSIQGFAIDTQHFGAVFRETKSFQDSYSSGLIGLAFGTISTSKKQPFFESLLEQRKVAAPYFAIYHTRGRTSGAEMCVGCVDTTKWRGNLQWVPINRKTYWSVPFTGYRTQMNGRTPIPSSPSISAAIDTGTSLIYFPNSLVTSFYSTIPNAREAPELSPGLWTFPCDSSLSIALELGGKMFDISPRDFNLGRTKKGSTDCVGAVVGIGNNGNFPNGLAVVGLTFLKNWYAVYDYSHGGRVGLARSITSG